MPVQINTVARSLAALAGVFTLAFSGAARMGQAQVAGPQAPETAQNGSAFTYQGQLLKNGAPVTAKCNATFTLFDAAFGGAQLGPTVSTNNLSVVKGLFTIDLDFGWSFTGEARWLETAIGCDEPPVTLSPRAALRPAPYAFALPGLRTVPAINDILGNPTMNVIGGVVSAAVSNTISASSYNSVIVGGSGNRIDNLSAWSVIAGGRDNLVSGGMESFIAVGDSNRISGILSAIGGGKRNEIGVASDKSVIAGGDLNVIDNSQISAIAGGGGNHIEGGSDRSFIGGGLENVITSAIRAMIPGGDSNRVEGDYGFAAGRQAQALHNGVFVWADSTDAPISSTAANQLIVRASGGVTMFTDGGATVGATLAAGSGSWSSVSDRNVKANVAAVDPRQVLEAVAALPVSTWNYNTQDPAIRHIGPMAQDFYAAFRVGETATGISVVDAQGVALAAIQGLKAENDDLRAQNTALAARLERLEQAQPAAAPWPWLAVTAVSTAALLGARRRWRK